MFSSGAMFGAQASQGFNMGGMDSTQSAGMDSQAAKKPRQEIKETCLPVTIRAVEIALERRGETGEDLKFYGVAEPQMVLVVAAVESLARQASSLEVVMNDGTGRIKGRWFLADPSDGELDRIVPGSYVSAFGEVRASPVPHLALKGMRPIESADEVSYHMIEVAHAALQIQKQQSGGKSAEPATPMKEKVQVDALAATATPEKPTQGEQFEVAANPYAVAAEAKTTAPAGNAAAAPAALTGAELSSAVLDALRDAGAGPEGLHLDAIVSAVSKKSAGVGAAEVKAAVLSLVDDGDLFTTITEEHFAAV